MKVNPIREGVHPLYLPLIYTERRKKLPPLIKTGHGKPHS